MSKVFLLTGATGFVGEAILRQLLNSGYVVKVITRDEKYFIQHANRNLIKQNIVTTDLFEESNAWMEAAVNGVDVVIHAAWYVEPGRYLNSDLNFKCFEGSVRLARACLNREVKQFIGIGTCFEYDLEKKIFSNLSRLNPKSIYAATKVATYFSLNSLFATSDVKFLWCRLFYLFGQKESESRLVALMHKNLANNINVELSDGNQIRDFIDVDLAAKKIIELAIEGNVGAQNICSSCPISIKDFAIEIADTYGRRDLLKFGARPRNLTDPNCVVGISDTSIFRITYRYIILTALILIEKVKLFLYRYTI